MWMVTVPLSLMASNTAGSNATSDTITVVTLEAGELIKLLSNHHLVGLVFLSLYNNSSSVCCSHFCEYICSEFLQYHCPVGASGLHTS